jgi:hypothetical protein
VPKAEGGGSKIDLTLHSVAIVIPSGYASKFLKKLVDFFLWLTKPPMDPKIFEGDWAGALAFLQARRAAYVAGELALKPPRDLYAADSAANGATTEAPPVAARSAAAAGGGARAAALTSAARADISSSSSNSSSSSSSGSGSKRPPPARRRTWTAALRSVSFTSSTRRGNVSSRGKGAPPLAPPTWAVLDQFDEH